MAVALIQPAMPILTIKRARHQTLGQRGAPGMVCYAVVAAALSALTVYAGALTAHAQPLPQGKANTAPRHLQSRDADNATAIKLHMQYVPPPGKTTKRPRLVTS